MKIKGSCGNCGRQILIEQIVEGGGRCPWCGRSVQEDYAVVLVDALRDAEAAGNTLENALEKVAGMHPNFVLDEDSILARVEGYLAEIRRGRPRTG